MKKFGFLAAILMLVGAVMLVTPQPQPAQAVTPGFSQACHDLAENSPDVFNSIFESHGDCVSTLQNTFNNGNAGPVGFCKVIEGPPWIPGVWKNLGDCISFVRHL